MTRDHRPTFLIASYPGISGIAGVFFTRGFRQGRYGEGGAAHNDTGLTIDTIRRFHRKKTRVMKSPGHHMSEISRQKKERCGIFSAPSVVIVSRHTSLLRRQASYGIPPGNFHVCHTKPPTHENSHERSERFHREN